MLVRVEYPRKLGKESPVITGSFTESKWTRKIPMRYSLSSSHYAIELWMAVTDMFQIYEESKIVVLPQFLTSQYHSVKGQACMLPARSEAHYQHLLRFHAKKTRKAPLFHFHSASSVIPKPGHLPEDCHFLDPTLLGIADGVGGWRSLGIDSGKFASELMSACKAQSLPLWSLVLSPVELSEDSQSVPYSFLVPVAQKAVDSVQSLGSATLLLCALHSGLLEIFNLGDCQAMLLRWVAGKLTVVLRTRAMQHAFNCPYQLSKPLSSLEKTELLTKCSENQRKPLRCNRLISDRVDRGDVYTVRVTDGDLLIVGSDGLWDNLYDADIVREVARETTAREVVRRLTKAAFAKSQGKGKTPFEEEAVAVHGERAWKGGKADDITVLAAWIRTLPL